MKKKPFLLPAAAFSLALLIALGFGIHAHREKKAYQARLEQVYEGAVLSALRQMEDMQLSIYKALLSQDGGRQGRYLSQVSTGADQVQRSLSLLPLSHGETARAVKFANQLSDYAAHLIALENITPSQADQLLLLIAACDQSTRALQEREREMVSRAAAGEDAFYPGDDESTGYDSQVSYPSLIYDGPFSDGADEEDIPVLGTEITREQAHHIARDFVGADRVSAVAPGADMGGSIPCYGVTIHLSDQVTLEAAVTVEGGKILWMAPDTADFAREKSLEECRQSALAFLTSRGYENMRPTYFQAYEGVMVISFAPVQGDALLYPDLIKVQLRMDNGQVVGWEARNFLSHHHPRGPLIPALTMEEAQGMVSDRLKIDACRLCLIPKNQKEILCYEFQGDFQGHTYLVYINGNTGEQEEILKIVENEAGIETV